MKAARLLEGCSDFEIQDIVSPIARPGAVVVRVEHAFLPTYFKPLAEGLFGTPPRPFTTGQCAIGVVESCGEGVDSLKPGQRVYCDMYLETTGVGVPQDYGFIGCFGPGRDAARMLEAWPDGTFAQQVLLPRQCVTPILPEVEISSELLCRLGWFAVCHAGLERGGFVPGSRLAVNGASGLLGGSAVMLALALGAGEVSVFGRRKEVLESLSDLDPRVKLGGNDGNFEFLLECSGGDSVDITIGLIERLERGGTTVFVGALGVPLPVDASLLMRSNLSLVGSFWFPRRTPAAILRLIAGGALDLSVIEAEIFSLSEINTALAKSVATSSALKHVALDCQARA